jgi:formylglycine-generating enzyme required for sulfatase activity
LNVLDKGNTAKANDVAKIYCVTMSQWLISCILSYGTDGVTNNKTINLLTYLRNLVFSKYAFKWATAVMEESESKREQHKNLHNSVTEINSNTYIEGTPTSDELLKICDLILEDNENKKYITLLREYVLTDTANSQNKVQLAKNITNAGEIKELHIGDRTYYNTDAETIKTVLKEILPDIFKSLSTEVQLQQNNQISFFSNVSYSNKSEDFLVVSKSEISLVISPLPKLNSFEFEVVTVDYQGRETKHDHKQAQYFPEDLGNGILLEIVSIPGGNFQMGASREEEGSQEDERPQHLVNIKSFFMGKYPITQGQWRTVANLPQINRYLNPEPSYFQGENLPVERVSWYEVQEFCARISQKTGRIYRLPSETEWEYACRANMTFPFYFGSTITRSLANFCEQQKTNVVHRSQTTEVGTFFANSFGLYDMHGNVWEWCADYQHEDYQDAPSDGTVWEIEGNPEYRMLRGGSWDYDFSYCRSASRYFENPSTRNKSFGFRVVCRN